VCFWSIEFGPLHETIALTVKQEIHDIQDLQDSQRNPSKDIAATATLPGRSANLIQVYDLPVAQCVSWAIDNYLNFGEGEEWQSPLFSFVRIVKGHPDLIGLTSKGALQTVERILKGRLTGDPWSRHFYIDREDAQVEFLACWEKIRFVPGWDPLDQAVERSKKMQLIPKNERTDGYQNFVSIAGWLQVTMGDRNIMLPCEKLGELLNCTQMTISRYRQWAMEDGLLTKMKEHRFKAGGGGDATEFRFDTSRYDCLAAKAQKET